MSESPNLSLHRMDCMELMAKYDDNHFDLAIVDPPYGIGAGKRKRRGYLSGTFNSDRYKLSNFDKNRPKPEYFKELRRVSRNQIIWGDNYFADMLPVNRGWCFWDKKPNIPNYSDGELAWTSFDKVLKRFICHWNGKIRSGIEPGYKAIHPTQKPIKLYRYLLQNYANPGDKILDTHLGSGSIAIACLMEGFYLTGSEIEKSYFDAMQKRIANHQAQPTIFDIMPKHTEPKKASAG